MRPLHPATHRVVDLVAAFDLTVHGVTPEQDATLSGVSVASGDVRPGDLFVALSGLKVHGATFAAQAVEAGAVAILTDQAGAELLAGA